MKMNFKDMLQKMSQLNEAKEKTKTGVKHTADAGGYGRKVDVNTDDEPKKKRGGQEKDEGPKFDTPKGDIFGRTSGTAPKGKPGTKVTKMADADKAEKKAEKAEKKKASLKDWIEHMDAMIAENNMPGAQLNVKPMPGASQLTDPTGKVIAQGPADKIKAMQASMANGDVTMPGMGDGMNEEDVGKHNNANTGFDALVRKLTPKYGVEAAKRIAGAQLKKIKEADVPPNDSDFGAGLGAGRSQAAFEAKKPDANKNGIPDYAEDGKGKNDLKKKTKVKEGMEARLKAAMHKGKSHALAKESYNCKYDDMEEARMYHEGFKQGLDECYGQAPIQGYVGEESTTDVIDDMASYGAYDDVDEGNAFTGALNRTPHGGQFKVGGNTFTDRSTIEEDPVFESWDNQLNSLIEEYGTIQEGLNVSISKGNEGAPDSVSVTAQDGEADQLLQFIKNAGLGLFGGEEQQPGLSSPMSQQVDGEPSEIGTHGPEIGVVGDHDGMMDLIKKVTGAGAGQPSGGEISASSDEGDDYEGEEGSSLEPADSGDDDGKEELTGSEENASDKEETDEESCNECGMAESDCGCSHDGKEQVEEVESEDQMEYEMAEDNAPDSGAEEFASMDQEIATDNAAASSHGGAQNSNLEEEDELEESLANGADDQFEADIDFMTNVISGGLNGKKTTGQSTIPVVASQESRLGNPMQESVNLLTDWKALAGIK